MGGMMKQDRIDRIDSIDKSPAQTKTLMERVEESYIWGLQRASGLTLASMISDRYFARAIRQIVL
jgi:hypothetical protein